VLDREKLAQALDWYKSHFSYEYALIAGSERVDLNGKKAGTVTPAEQREARARVAAQKRELRERQQIPPPPTVSANTAKINGAVVTKAVSPSLHPLLADMQSAIGIVSSILTDKQYEALRPALAAAALKEIIDRAERLSHEVNPT
jgi:sRNA-binding protein